MDKDYCVRWRIDVVSLAFFVGGLMIGMGFVTFYIKYKKSNVCNHYFVKNSLFHLVESSKDIIYHFEIKPDFRHHYISPSVDSLLGDGTMEKVYENSNFVFEIIHPDDFETIMNKINGTIDFHEPVLQRFKTMDGEYIWFEEYTTPIYKHGKLVAVQGIMRNVDEKIKLQQHLERRAMHDPLTAICNRNYFEHMMDVYDKQTDAPVAMILCDLDELKQINDHYGHKMGDEAIKRAADFLQQHFAQEAVVSRIGGDEFAILLIDSSEVNVQQRSNQLHVALAKYNQKFGELLKMSIGSAFKSSSIGNMEKLYTEADAKMYEQKRARKNMRLVKNL